MTRRPATLVKRYNADNSLSILCRGRVQIRFPLGHHGDCESFAKGWFGDSPQRWGRPQFRLKARTPQPGFAPGEAELIANTLEPQLKALASKVWAEHPNNPANRKG